MYVLGIETATPVGSVAVANENGLVAEYTLIRGTTHSERLLPVLDHLLKSASLPFRGIDVLAISLGPGSFTGLRIGVSTAKGLALAGEKPVVGISTLDALAENYRGIDTVLCPMLDARKKEVFAAVYRGSRTEGLEKLTPDLAIPPERIFAYLEGNGIMFLGDGSILYRSLIEQAMGAKAGFAPPHLNHPRAATVALLGLQEAKRGNFLDLKTFTPIYVRSSDAELKKDHTVEPTSTI